MEATEQLLCTAGSIFNSTESFEVEIQWDNSADSMDVYYNEIRQQSRVLENKSGDTIYLAITPSWFTTHISKQLGNVVDCYISQANSDETQFSLCTHPAIPGFGSSPVTEEDIIVPETQMPSTDEQIVALRVDNETYVEESDNDMHHECY